jgi:glycosyltransferase involved in cell wall biosynthesis
MNSLRTLRVIGSMDPKSGGPCQGLRNSIPNLIDKGITSEVVTVDAPGDAFSVDDLFPIHRLGPANNSWFYTNLLIPWLSANLHRFDVVIVHGLWLHPSYATWKAVSRLRRADRSYNAKLFLMSHGMLDPWFQRHPSRRLKAWRNWFYWKLIEKHVVNGVDGILFTCEQELLLARETFAGYRPKREMNVGYGVVEPPSETTMMRDALHKICPDIVNKPYLLFISRIHPKKGVDLLLNAYSKLRESVHGSEIKMPDLVIAGPTDSTYAQEMIALAERLHLLGVAPVVHFVGMLQGDAKWGAFYGCDAFVLPSHQENFGIAVAEALACGKPVLISNQVNIWREIESSGAGFVADDNEDGTYQLLDRWCRLSEMERRSMQTKARACYQDHFDVAVSTGRMAEALRSVVNDVR